ncbi:hypothetical protein Ahy_A06g028594 [Arachis hypogaea]|uniref:hAT-like transposase RNase-H fold domain-containing protein n=1 Tax=Arachis hypogaea TaxID=3818 RepID=A0A445CRD8_ARAHY|nr:hypothetical protein Ahy_A06g028594 [Arachis hypogaea]
MNDEFAIGRFIRHSCDSVDFSTMSMTERMRVKYEKYWDNPDSVNMLLLIAIVLNLMQKIEFVNYFLDYFFGEEKGGELKSKLSKCIKLLYQQHQSSEEASEADMQDGITYPLTQALLTDTLLQQSFNYILITHLCLGIAGAAAASTASNLSIPFSLVGRI